jgi:hypothetical protein
MRLECIKYEFPNDTEDIDINFFSDVVPVEIETVDLYDYYKDETMSEVEYSFEDIAEDNTLYLRTSNLSFDCINNNQINETLLFDFFGVFELNKFLKWKFNYYEDDELLYSGIIYKDGVTVNSVEDDVLSIVIIGYEKEFKEYFNNKQIGSSSEFDQTSGVPTNPLPNLFPQKYYGMRSFLRNLFPNITFYGDTTLNHWLNYYYVAELAYTYSPNTNFLDYGNVMHIKTGYDCFYLDGINKMTYWNSLILPMGWIWYFYLNELVVQERSATDYAVLDIDCEDVEVSQSLKHNYNQFQVDNVIINNGQYFDSGQDFSAITSCFCIFDNGRPITGSSHNLSGQFSSVYSNNVTYSNRVRPFKSMSYIGTSTYLMDFRNHDFTRDVSQDEFNKTFENTTMTGSGNSLDFSTVRYNYNVDKSIIINPYTNSRNNSAGFDRNNARANDGAYYGNGNFYSGANQPITNSHGLYNGHAANSIIKYDSDIGKYVNYEMYTQTDRFEKNFKKFLKTNDELIIEIEVKQLITNPLQTIHLTNYQDANLEDKYFSIIRLSFHPIDKISVLTLQLIQ